MLFSLPVCKIQFESGVPMSKITGKFIVFEGLDGSGKSTQIGLLETYLRGSGRRVFVTAEPTGSETGVLLREALSGRVKKSPSELASLFVLDRIGHNIDPVSGINRMLEDGYDVICDRYYYSSLAYQGSETDFDWVLHMNTRCPEIRRPDLCIFLDLDPEHCMERIAARRGDREIYEELEKLKRIRAAFLKILEAIDDRVEIIDGAGSPEQISIKVSEAAKRLFGNEHF